MLSSTCTEYALSTLAEYALSTPTEYALSTPTASALTDARSEFDTDHIPRFSSNSTLERETSTLFFNDASRSTRGRRLLRRPRIPRRLPPLSAFQERCHTVSQVSIFVKGLETPNMRKERALPY